MKLKDLEFKCVGMTTSRVVRMKEALRKCGVEDMFSDLRNDDVAFIYVQDKGMMFDIYHNAEAFIEDSLPEVTFDQAMKLIEQVEIETKFFLIAVPISKDEILLKIMQAACSEYEIKKDKHFLSMCVECVTREDWKSWKERNPM